jgi:hypothetical protein
MSGQGQARRWKARTISAEHPLVDDEHLPLILKPMDIPEIPKRPASLSKASSHASLKLVLCTCHCLLSCRVWTDLSSSYDCIDMLASNVKDDGCILRLPADCVPFATSYVMYDVMAAMSVPVKAEMNLNNAQLGMIFSSYSIVSSAACEFRCAVNCSVAHFRYAFVSRLAQHVHAAACGRFVIARSVYLENGLASDVWRHCGLCAVVGCYDLGVIPAVSSGPSVDRVIRLRFSFFKNKTSF